MLVFGKNEDNINKSLNKEDLTYFKSFLNISIIYVPNLHAKYYGNDNKGVLTSMNLYDYSIENNIEFGVFTEHNIISKIGSVLSGDNADTKAWDTCMNIAHEHDAIFIKRPMYETKKFLINLSKNYIKSEILHDYTEDLFGLKRKKESKTLEDFPEELELGASYQTRPPHEKESSESKPNYRYKENTQQLGFCIRTGEQIKFDPQRPFTYSAWQSWNKYADIDYKEKFCHKTGKLSYGKTSMRNPILN